MSEYVGVFFTQSDWVAAFLNIDSTSLTTKRTNLVPLTSTRRGSADSLFDRVKIASQFIPATQTAGRSVQAVRTEGEISKDVVSVFSEAGLKNYFQECVLDQMDEVGTVCIAHSYGMSPVIRRGLSPLIHLPVIEHHRTSPNERSTTIRPFKTKSIERGCAIEVPFAACLELLVRKRLQPCEQTERVIILGGSEEGVEATVVNVSRNLSTVTFSAKKHFSGSTEKVAAWLDNLSNNLSDSLDPLPPQKQRVFLIKGTNASPALGESIDLSDIASGAARYAALCAGEQPGVVLEEAEIQKIEFASVVPHAIGLCGQTPQGELIWSPLFEAGETLSGETRSVSFSDETIPPRLILAESLQQDRIPGEWMIAAPVDQLRWYAEVPVVVPPNVTAGSVAITIQSSTENWNYGWSDPFISAVFVPLAITP
jgi:hypothetical protein